MSKRVCLVGPVHPYRGGIAQFTSLLANEFAANHDTRVISFTRLYPDFLFPGRTQYEEGGESLLPNSVRIIDSIGPHTYVRAGRAIKEFAPDLLVFQWWHPFFAPAYRGIRLAAGESARRAVYLCHNVQPHESSPIDRVLTRVGFGGVDRFLVQSRDDREQLLRLKPRASVLVRPHPIYDIFNQGRYTAESARRELGVVGPVVLFFGLIRPYKGLEVLLDGFARYRSRQPGTLFVVGEFYQDRAPYDEQIRRLGIGADVRVVDRYVPSDEVEKYFAAADVVVLPYHSATQSGIVQIAYGFNRPVIVTGVGGLPDVVEDGVTGFVVPPANAGALADAMVRFFTHADASVFAKGIEAAKSRFSWRACAEALLELGGLGAPN